MEVRVEWEGIVGVVDLLEPEGPTELKTTARVPPADRLIPERPTYLDQLGIYCALTERTTGRLVVVGEGEDGSVGPPLVLRCEFGEIPGIRADAAQRAERLRRSVRSVDPDPLPRCRWFGRNCPFQDQQICHCTGGEPPDDRWILDRLRSSAPDPESEARWRAALQEDLAAPAPVLRTYRDLVYPRRAYYERMDPGGTADTEPVPPELSEEYRALVGALEAGPSSERTLRPAVSGEPLGTVPLFRGAPFLVKTSRAAPPPDPPTADRLPAHYLEELGFRCAALGLPSGWIFVSYVRLPGDRRRWRAFEITPKDLPAAQRELEERRVALSRALETSDPSGLPPCPGWMVERCPYRSACGCGEVRPTS